MHGWPHPSIRSCAYHVLQVVSPLCWLFWLMSSWLALGSLLPPWSLVLSSGYTQFSIPHCYIFLSHFPTLCTSFLSLPISVSGPVFSAPPPLYLFLKLHMICGLCHWYSEIWAKIHLLVSAYHVFSFMSGIPHSGYLLVPSICLWISKKIIIFNSWLVLHCVNATIYVSILMFRDIWVLFIFWLL